MSLFEAEVAVVGCQTGVRADVEEDPRFGFPLSCLVLYTPPL